MKFKSDIRLDADQKDPVQTQQQNAPFVVALFFYNSLIASHCIVKIHLGVMISTGVMIAISSLVCNGVL